jgi:hypothetical protein
MSKNFQETQSLNIHIVSEEFLNEIRGSAKRRKQEEVFLKMGDSVKKRYSFTQNRRKLYPNFSKQEGGTLPQPLPPLR